MKYKVPHSSRAITAILLLLSPAVSSAVYYDSRDRAVQSVATNHLGGTDRSWTEYDFTGRPLRVRSEHRTPAMGADSAVVRTERRTYDRFGRELTLSHRYGDGAESREVTVRTNTYDAVGRLLTESLGDAAERTYEYDVRSRPVAITAYNYRQKLGFTYGGNVSRMTWWAYGPNETERSYTYSYDALSRLTEARYTDGEGGTGRYDVTYSYDLNGNVTALQRSGLYDNGSLKKYGLIDNLTLEYEGNMLRRVTDGCGAGPFYQGAYHFVDGADETQEYTYDGNGNTTMDLNRRVTAVGYDTNNRPRLIEFDGGSSTAYLYDAAGLKRLTVHRVATERPSVPGAEPQEPELSMTRTDYCGDIIYEDSLLSRINFDGGYLSFTNNAGERLDRPAYHFYHRDHLGNNRMDLGENGSVWQICHYYPYGMLMGCSYLGESQRWKFGGKELDRVSGLDLLDFEARPYDATLGRFWRPDDLADKYHPLSPFLYCAANPLVLIDYNGLAPRIYYQLNGFGHTFVTTGSGKSTTVYSYGRYGALGKDKSSARKTTPVGEGILYVLKGDDAKNYLSQQISIGVSVFQFSTADEQKVDQFFQSKFDSSDQIPTEGSAANDPNARVIDEYDIVDNNCTTMSLEAIEQSGGNVTYIKSNNIPAGACIDTKASVFIEKLDVLTGFKNETDRTIVTIDPKTVLNEYEKN